MATDNSTPVITVETALRDILGFADLLQFAETEYVDQASIATVAEKIYWEAKDALKLL